MGRLFEEFQNRFFEGTQKWTVHFVKHLMSTIDAAQKSIEISLNQKLSVTDPLSGPQKAILSHQKMGPVRLGNPWLRMVQF